MLDTEYNETEVMELFKEEGKAEGKIEGKAEGKIEGKKEGVDIVNQLNDILINQGRFDELKRTVKDPEYQKKLIRELIDKNYGDD